MRFQCNDFSYVFLSQSLFLMPSAIVLRLLVQEMNRKYCQHLMSCEHELYFSPKVIRFEDNAYTAMSCPPNRSDLVSDYDDYYYSFISKVFIIALEMTKN